MTERIITDSNGRKHITTEPLLHPQPRPWVGLTDGDYFDLQMKIKKPMISVQDYIDAMRMVEAALRSKNT